MARAQEQRGAADAAGDDLAAQHLEAQLDDISVRLHRLEQPLTEQRSGAGGG